MDAFRVALKRYIAQGYPATEAMRKVWRDVRAGSVSRPLRGKRRRKKVSRKRKRNPGAHWHGREKEFYRRMSQHRQPDASRLYYTGAADAHEISEQHSRRLGINPRVDLDTAIKGIRRALRAEGFKGRVKRGTGTASMWIKIHPLRVGDSFTPAEMALLRNLGFVPGGNLALISPDQRDFWYDRLVRAKNSPPRRRSRKARKTREITGERRAQRKRAAMKATARGMELNPGRRGRMFARSKRRFATARAAWKDIGTATGLSPRDVGRSLHTRTQWRWRSKNPATSQKRAVVIYDRLVELRAIKGNNSHYPGQRFYHRFSTPAQVLGMPDGSLRIVGRRGQRLWGTFAAK